MGILENEQIDPSVKLRYFGVFRLDVGPFFLPDFNTFIDALYHSVKCVIGPTFKGRSYSLLDTSILFPPIQVSGKPNIDLFEDILHNLDSIGEHAEQVSEYCRGYFNRIRGFAFSVGGSYIDQKEFRGLLRFLDILHDRCDFRLKNPAKAEALGGNPKRREEVLRLFRDLSRELIKGYVQMNERVFRVRNFNGLEGHLREMRSSDLFSGLYNGFRQVSEELGNDRYKNPGDTDLFLLSAFLYLANLRIKPVFLFTGDHHLNALMKYHDRVCNDCGIPTNSNSCFVYQSFVKKKDFAENRVIVRTHDL
jgi:hypothetical protein